MEFHWPKISADPASEFKTRGFFFMASPWLFPGGVGCFFDDRRYGGGVTIAKWLGRLVFYSDGRFSADVAFPFAALNMMYRRRSVEQSGMFLKKTTSMTPPANAAAIQDKLREGDLSFIDRLRHFGGGVLRGTDAYLADRSDDVGAWLQYRVGRKNGVRTLFITGSCAEFHWPELLERIEGAFKSQKRKSLA